MEWRAIPEYPGYEVSRRGKLRNATSGYVYGQNCMLKVGGRPKWANGPKLARIAFAEPADVDLPHVPSPFPASASALEQAPASAPVPAPVEPIPAPAPAPDPLPKHDPARQALQEMLDTTRRSLEIARRVNGHALALIGRQREEIKRLAAHAGKRRGRKAVKPAINEGQDIDFAALRFEDVEGEVW
jgi:hypothetical protein